MNVNELIQLSTLRLATAFSITALATTAWSQPFDAGVKLIASDGGPDHAFGTATAVEQGTVAVGAPHASDSGTDSGAVYLFDATTGSQLGKLVPSDAASGDEFGSAIDIRNGLVVIGAPSDTHAGVTSGSAYLFNAATGTQITKLVPSDAAPGDLFGYSVAIDGGVVAVGAVGDDELGNSSGSVYLFDAASGTQVDKLVPDEGAPNQYFGVSMAMDDDMLAVGSRSYFVLGEGFTLGAVRLYDTSTRNHFRTLTANNGTWTDFFGESIDIHGGLVAVGAWARSIFFDHSGAAYVFDAATGQQLQYIFPSDGHDRDNFGISVAINDGVLAVGAHRDGDNGPASGSAYLFDAVTGTQTAKLLASDGATFDFFGTSISLEGGLLAVGTIGDEDNGPDSGSVYLFGAADMDCAADVNGDGQLTPADFNAWIQAFNSNADACDQNSDGLCSPSDFNAWIQNYNTGC